MTRYLFLAVTALALGGCVANDCSDEQGAARLVNHLQSVRDARTGLCFVHESLRGNAFIGLSNVPCELVTSEVANDGGQGSRRQSALNYGQVQASGGDICFSYLTDFGENIQSNLAVVPCAPLQEAQGRGSVRIRRFQF